MGKFTKSEKKGTARMLELGYKPLQLWLAPTNHRILTKLAEKLGMPKTRLATELINQGLAKKHDCLDGVTS